MQSPKLSVLTLVLALALSACTAQSTPPPTPSPQPMPTVDETAPVRAAMQRYSQLVLSMDSKGIAAMFAPDGEIVNGGQVVAKGPAAIQTFLASFEGTVKVEENTDTIDTITINGDTAAVTASYHQKALTLSNNQEVVAQGHLKVIWTRQADGQWLIQTASTGS